MKTVSKLKTAIMYAEAMYSGAEKTGDLDALYTDADTLSQMSDKDFEQITLINNPLLVLADKVAMLETLAARMNFCLSMKNTLKILAENRKLDLLLLVCRQFMQIYQQKHNIAEVEVTTVVPLDKSQEKKLIGKLEAVFHKEIILKYVINPQIIGGLVIRYGTNFIDNSILHKLNALEQLMKGTK